jgi:hypothetical protein
MSMSIVDMSGPDTDRLVEEGAAAQGPDFAMNAKVRDLLVRFRGVGGEADDLLIFERVDPKTTSYGGGLESLADEIIRRVQALARESPEVQSLLEGKKGVGIV